MTVLLLGCTIVEIVLIIFISCINGRLAHPSVHRKWERPAFYNKRGKNSCNRRVREQIRGGVSGDDGQEAEDVSVGASVSVAPV